MKLYGWDTAFAIDAALANRALANAGQSVLIDFDADDRGRLGLRASGSFGHWQIVEGGSGQFINLRMPIVSGQLETTAPQAQTIDLAGVAFVASVGLDLLPSGTNPRSEDLRFDVSSASEIGSPPSLGAITPIRIDDPQQKLDDVQEALLMVALASYVASHAERISFIFATINLVPPQGNSWLTPIRSAFAYADRAGSAGGALVILSVTSDREIGGLARQVDPALLSSSYQAAYAFSGALFLENVVMPALPAAFAHGATPASFQFDSTNSRVVNVGALPMDQVKSGAIYYSPIVRSLGIGLNTDALAGRFTGDCDLKAGISMTFWVEPDNTIIYDAGTQALGFLADPNAASGYTAHIPWYWWFGGPLVRLIVEIVVRVISNSLAASLTKNVAAVLSPIRNPPTSIQWSETSDLLIGTASVNENFLMAGNFADPARAGQYRGGLRGNKHGSGNP